MKQTLKAGLAALAVIASFAAIVQDTLATMPSAANTGASAPTTSAQSLVRH